MPLTGTYILFINERFSLLGLLRKGKFPSSFNGLVPTLADPRSFIFFSFLKGGGGGGEISHSPVLSSSPIVLGFCYLEWNQNYAGCFWIALLLKNRLRVGQNRLSPCKWGVRGHNFMCSHLSLSQRHFRLVVCLHWWRNIVSFELGQPWFWVHSVVLYLPTHIQPMHL